MKPQPKMRYAGAFAVLLALLAVLFVWMSTRAACTCPSERSLRFC